MKTGQLKILVRSMQEKADIRRFVLEKRNRLTKEELVLKSHDICNRLIHLEEYKNAKVIYFYMDFKNEVMTKLMIENAFMMDKKVALPKIDGDEMNFYYTESLGELKKGYFGILEPDMKNPAEDKNALMIVPGVAFDESGFRLGFGKGYYDKFLSKHMEFTKMAVAFELQIVNAIPYEKHDITMDKILTETREILCQK